MTAKQNNFESRWKWLSSSPNEDQETWSLYDDSNQNILSEAFIKNNSKSVCKSIRFYSSSQLYSVFFYQC